MGVFWAPPESVELEFDARVTPYVRGRVWHESQRIDDLADGRIRVTLNVSNDWALRSWILGFGSAVRVVQPAALAETIRHELRLACARYEADPDVRSSSKDTARPPLAF